MLPPVAEKKLRSWIRSRHLICSGNYFILESFEISTIERFGDCIETMGGTLICVNTIGKIWVANQRQAILYQAKASLLTPNNPIKQYWIKYGAFHTRFDAKLGRS